MRFFFFLLIFVFRFVLAQDCKDLLDFKTIELDSITKEIKQLRIDYNRVNQTLLELRKRISNDSAQLAEWKDSDLVLKNKDLEGQISNLTDEINSLISKINKNELSLINLTNQMVQKSDSAKKAGIEQVYNLILSEYKYESFDLFVSTYTLKKVNRDIDVIKTIGLIPPIMNDLMSYFEVKSLFDLKYQLNSVNSGLEKLDQINVKSVYIDSIREKLEDYEKNSTELNEVVSELITLDDNTVSVGNKNAADVKFNIILSKLSNYMYNYTNYVYYPYLKNKVDEIIRRKRDNSDADISDLLD